VRVAGLVDTGEVDEHQLGLVLPDHLQCGRGHRFVVGGLRPRLSDAADLCECVELALARNEGGAHAVAHRDLEDGRRLRPRDVGGLRLAVPDDPVPLGRDAGQHARVRRQRDGHRHRARPEGVAAGADQLAEVGHVGPQKQVGPAAVDADEQGAFEPRDRPSEPWRGGLSVSGGPV
jgi:hypothetical protein